MITSLGVLLFGVINVFCLYLYFITHKKNDVYLATIVNQEKANISSVSALTAYMFTFRDDNKNFNIFAVSAEMEQLYHVVFVNKKVERNFLHISALKSVDAVIDGKPIELIKQDCYAATVSQNATNCARVAVAMLNAVDTIMVRTMNLRLAYITTDQKEMSFDIPFKNAKSNKDNMKIENGKMLLNLFWWAYFLKLAKQAA